MLTNPNYPITHTDICAVDQIIKTTFKDVHGRFLVIGCNSGYGLITDLLEQGWTGVCVEPDPFACSELIKNLSKFSQSALVVNAAITVNGSIQDFYISTELSAVSSLVHDWLENFISTAKERKNFDVSSINFKKVKVKINTIGIEDLFKCVGTDFNLVIIDAEGVTDDLVKAVNWGELLSCQMLVFESPDFGEIVDHLCSQGYALTDITPIDTVYQKISHE